MQYQNKIQIIDSSLDFLRKHNQKPESSMPWMQLHNSLLAEGMSVVQIQALTSHLFDFSKNQTNTIRVLHDLEKDMITPQAHGLLIELMQLGILPLADSEPLLEKIIQTASFPIDTSKLKVALLDYLLKEARQNGLVQIH